MTSKLISLIEMELPEFFEIACDKLYFPMLSLEHMEELIKNFLRFHYPHENQIEERNKFRIKWNLILTENEKV